MKKINIALIALLAFGAVSVSAQRGDGNTDTQHDVTTNPSTGTAGLPPLPPKPPAPPAGIRPPMPPVQQKGVRPEIREVRKDIKDARIEIKDARKDIRNETKDMRASAAAARKDMRGETKENRMETIEQIKALRATTTEARKNIREEMESRSKELRASTTLARVNMKDEAQKKRLEIARKQTELVSTRLVAATERVQKLSDRVSTTLITLEGKGVDVAVARAHIADATVKLDEARTKVAGVKLAIETAFVGATPKESMKGVQDLVKDTAKTIQDAHDAVAKAISSIKPGQNRAQATTTTGTATGATTQQ